MNTWVASCLLVAGALVCLLAATGVLRLQDFFMRMHAATKAGVVGSGLVLLGVAVADGSLATWVKVLLAIVFLLLTTPVAGHLLGRAGYVGGAPLWRGTTEDHLRDVLPRGRFGPATAPTVRRVVLALTEGPCMARAIGDAVALAREQGAELCGVAIIDTPRLANVGPVPLGALTYAQRMRERRLTQARQAAADVIQRFEQAANDAGLVWSVRLEEGRPRRLLHAMASADTVVAVAPQAWFDQGVLAQRVDVVRRLRWRAQRPLRVLGG
ncbi:monovalent cation/H(+) antiporter subunit G [Hydrogenophaga sp.]|uniref:monovalent cation/H(+) antiporter subunit G n=1 Tax=Hydrogenophaga sp. TaxID=1904254 RepID=UPI00260339D3|nr:monovalent cation/H(+) antiporter subunit G [Hydrogenophaga sp.]MCW5652819.1 monovalent cation/H(+) antiporter subunit G [Hydrogenophaga sp.]